LKALKGLINTSATSWRLFENFSPGINLVVVPNLSWAYDIQDNLNSFAVELPCFVFPEMETDLLRNRGVSERRRIERISFFSGIKLKTPGVYILCAEALCQKTPSLPFWDKCSHFLKINDTLSCTDLAAKLLNLGYENTELVEKPFQYAMRGSIIDVFTPLNERPMRIELFGDEVESIHSFFPDSQRRDSVAESLFIPPAREFIFPVDDAKRTLVKSQIRGIVDEEAWERSSRNELLERIELRSFFPSIDYWSSIISKEFFNEDPWEIIFAQANSIHLCEPPQSFVATQKAKNLQTRDFETAYIEGEWIPPKAFFFLEDESLNILEESKDLLTFTYEKHLDGGLGQISTMDSLISKLANSRSDSNENPLKNVAEILKAESNGRFFIFLSTSSDYERLKFLLGHYGLELNLFSSLKEAISSEKRFSCLLGTMAAPFRDESTSFNFLNDEQILGTKKKHLASRQISSAKRISEINTNTSFLGLKAGSHVVHKDHGIAKYLGLKTMSLNGVVSEFIELEYSDGKVFLPVIRLSLIQKYAGGEKVNLDRLSTRSWEQKKKKAKKELRSIAGELLDLYAKRKLAKAPIIDADKQKIETFAASFPFTETQDQLQAIEESIKDLKGPSPMDRLICGDVGYGKTEVAIRATFSAISAGFQACVLVPTTLLAAQHYKSFADRLGSFGFKVALLSRFTSKEDSKKAREGLENGSLNVIIGTHRVLSSDIKFKRLGLLVVDEEQRFGVTHKEKVKRLKANVHVLTMTATPIPRTMNMAMSGIRDMSIIATPPQSRLSVRTHVARKKKALIVDAVTREISRDGQVFFVHNRVKDIEKVYNELKELFPKYTITYVHGQMNEKQLEERMLAFYEGKTQILITTSIIESGLDVPNANTLIIDRADMFGLAQLYQMRGRVGRSDKRAFAYLLIPEQARITRDAEERLSVLESYQELGSGFHIASHDLDLRGSGDLLGRSQSGQMSALGFETFNEILQECVSEVKGEHLDESIDPEINIPIDMTIPEDYIHEVNLRLLFYRRLSSVRSESEVHEIEQEIEDRFGSAPESVKNLLIAMELKCVLRRLMVRTLSSGKSGLLLSFDSSTPVKPIKLVEQIRKFPKHFHLYPDGRLALLNVGAVSEPKKLLRGVEAALSQIESWCE